MTPWPDIPDLPGHVVEVGRREDGARRRLDLFVHPEGMQPHHVAIRLDLWDGRVPELYAGFGAEARPVCLPEHLAPQEAAVEAAAEIVARMVGEPAAAHLREQWAGVRVRLEERHSEIVREKGRLCRFVIGRGHRPILLCEPTRPGRWPKAEGMVLAGSSVGSCGTYAWNNPPLDEETVAARTDMSAHQKLALLEARTSQEKRLREGFASMGQRPVFTLPIALDGWIAWCSPAQQRMSTRVWNHCSAIHMDGSTFSMGFTANDDEGKLGEKLYVTAEKASGGLIEATIGARRASDGKLGSASLRYHPYGSPRDAKLEELDVAMRLLLSVSAAIDPDCSMVSAGRVGSSKLDQLDAHPLVQGLRIVDSVRPIAARLLSGPYDAKRRKISSKRKARR